MSKKIHFLQHASFEGPAIISDWAQNNGFAISFTHLYKQEKLPKPQDIDMLVVLGGPMGVYDSNKYSWLTNEIEFISKSIQSGKSILGICLGAQLIAYALGSNVYKGPYKEIGWYPVIFAYNKLPILLPEKLSVFHWHGDTFDLPKESILFASTESVINQAFIYREQVIALQFHLEMNDSSIQSMITNAGHELSETGKYIMSEKAILSESDLNLPSANQLMISILTYLSSRIN